MRLNGGPSAGFERIQDRARPQEVIGFGDRPQEVIGFGRERGSIRRVFQVPLERELRRVVVGKIKSQKNVEKRSKTGKTGIA